MLVLCHLQLVQNYTQNLIDMNKMISGTFNLVKEPFDPEKLLSKVCSMFEPNNKVKKFSLKWVRLV